ncbi:MAG: response regulator, partial [Clostridia bacterium]
MKVCVLSEDEKFIKELSLVAKEHDIDVCGSTGSGNIGLLLIKQSAPDVTVLDAVLCDIDGLQVLEKIKEQELKTKTIIVTGINNSNIIQKAINLGSSFYIIKPTTYERIIERIKDVYEVLPLSNPMPEFAGRP